MITYTKEDYIRAFFLLNEEKGVLRSVDVANYLNLSKPSVSEMIRTLRKEDFIEFTNYSKLRLTNKGEKFAKKLTYKHRIIELFLRDILKMDSKNVHEEANRLEHAFSDEAIERLKEVLGNPKKDPHGKPILY